MENRTTRSLFLAVTALGISSVITQITFTRELLNIFQGNELVIGLVMSFWLILTGLGAWAGRFRKLPRQAFIAFLVLTALLPFFQIFGLRFFRDWLSVPGAAADFRSLFILLPVILAPCCLMSGYMLTLACALFSETGNVADAGRVYFMDNIGDILGGIIFSFGLIYISTNFEALYLPCLLNTAAAWQMCRVWGFRKTSWAVPAVLLVPCLLYIADADSRSMALLFPGQRIESFVNSPYGRLVTTFEAGQRNFYENGIPFHSQGDALDAETAVHFALAQTKGGPLNVLLISGGVTGVVGEVRKYPAGRIDYVELDPAMIRLAGDELFPVTPLLSLSEDERDEGTAAPAFDAAQARPARRDGGAYVHQADGRMYVDTTKVKYDAVIISLPPPENIQLNRFYSLEFFTALKRILKPGGIASFTLPSGENYISRELSDLYGVMYATAVKVFPNVAAWPAERAVFLLSDSALDPDIAGKLEEKGIRTRYMNRYFLRAALTPDRMDQMRSHLRAGDFVNRDLHPAAFHFLMKYRLSVWKAGTGWLLWLLAGFCLLFLFFLRPAETALWSTGFTSISLEIVVLLLFQVHAGYVYQSYSLMLTLFMAGLAGGSWAAIRVLGSAAGRRLTVVGRRRLLLAADLAVTVLLVFLGIAMGWPELWKNHIFLYMCITAGGMLTGAEFPFAAAISDERAGLTASRLYAADFLGAGIGSLLTAVFLIPLLGVATTVFILAALKLPGLAKLGYGKEL